MKKKSNIRLVSQIFFFTLIVLISLNKYLTETGRQLPFIGSASLHSICPFGGVAAFTALFKYDVMIPKIHPSTFSLLAIILLLGVIFGAVVCGYMCPLGSVQEWFGKLGKKLLKKRYNHIIPNKLDRILRYLRYGVLFFVVYMTTTSLKLVFEEIDPYFALFNFWSDKAAMGGLFVLGVTLLLSLFVQRPWCKYACPFGALIGLTNFFSIFKIRRNGSTCISCKQCDKICPMNITISDKNTVMDHQCIRCGQCTSEIACPVSSTVELKVKNYREGTHEE